MAEAVAYNMDAVRSDGFVDFYGLLGTGPTASEDELRGSIQSLFSEAQANRDHRNLNKRRDYQALLEYLPQARTALLDPAKRAQYDEYAAAAAAGRAPAPFGAFISQLGGAQDDGAERTAVLGVQDGGRAPSRNTSTTASPSASASANSSAPRPTSDAGTTRRQPQVAGKAQAGLMASVAAVVVFAVLAGILFVVTKGNIGIALAVGGVAAVVVWFVARPKGGTPVGR